MSTIRVTGSATATATPDAVDIRFEVKTRNKDYATTIGQLDSRVAALKDALVRADVPRDDIHTIHFDIATEMDYIESRRIFVGYEGTHRLEVRIDFDRKLLNAIVAAAAESGAEPGAQLAFVVRDESALRDEALRNAVASATRTANLLAIAAGTSLGPLCEIVYGDIQRHETRLNMFLDRVPQVDFSRSIAVADVIAPSEVKVSESVEISWTSKISDSCRNQ
ncbi:MAG: SIMPL domain-containing protein [Rhodocyclaceae bacterium]|nr:SIMPL domain-containing protein [Rhodocyclaceae bacterium]